MVIIPEFDDRAKAIPLDDILVENSTYTSTTTLKKRLLKEGMLKYECSICGISKWRGQKLSLQIDHINGTNDDNRIGNLRLLCPNCHSQTPTFAGKGLKQHKKCIDCGTNISKVSARCKSCVGKQRGTKINWPDTETLLQKVKETSYSAVAKELGVSDNAVRKRIRNHS